MQVHFYAEKKSKDRYTVYLKCYVSGEAVKFYPKIQCEDWDKKKERALGFNKANINDELNRLELKALDIEHDLKREGRLTKENFLRLLRGETQRDFFACFSEFIHESRTRVNRATGKTLVAQTINHYKSCVEILKEFDKIYPISFEAMDMRFYGRFRSWYIGKGNNHNTFGGKIKMIKTFLTWASYQGIPINPIYKKFERPSKYSDAEPLTAAELQRFWKIDLSEEPARERAFDIFLFLCSTGLRISDYNNLTKENFKEDHIKINAQKTSAECIIPFFDDQIFRPVSIYQKYDGELPKLSGQKLNKMLKLIAIEKKFKRIDLTSKTGRKTFATLNVLNGVSPLTVMRSTGHKDYKSFQAYVGISAVDVVKEFKDKATFLKAI
jgi:integrase